MLDVGAIDDLKREHAKRMIILIFFVVLVASLALRQNLYGAKAFRLDLDRVSGTPDRVSYEIPDFKNAGDIITEDTLFPVVCRSFGSIKCTEPIAEYYRFTSTRTSSSGYLQWLYFMMRNDDTSDAKIVSIQASSGGSEICNAAGSGEFNITMGGTHGLIIIGCSEPKNPGIFNGAINITYIVEGVAKNSLISVTAR